MAFVWQIREKNSGMWLQDTSQGCNYLVEQDHAFLWRREDLAEKALKKILKMLQVATDPNHKNHKWYKHYATFHVVQEGKPQHTRKNVEFEIVCSKLVLVD